MPLARYITVFQEKPEAEAINVASSGCFTESELESLARNETRPAVKAAIEAARQSGAVVRVDEYLKPVHEVEKSKSALNALLLSIADQINTEHAAFEEIEKQATMSMLKIGLKMEYVKEMLPHGQFKKWAEANLIIKYRHAHNYRKLAQVFIKSQQIGEGEMLALVNPENSKAELGEKLRQMAFAFLGDRTQAELFELHKIKSVEPQKRTYHPPHELPELPEGETWDHKGAVQDWTEIMEKLDRAGLRNESWALLTHEEREVVYNTVNELAKRLRESLKTKG